MFRKILVITGLVGVLLSVSCEISPNSQELIHDTIESYAQISHPTPPTKTVGVYMDVTSSMDGFLCTRREIRTSNYYTICLDNLQNMIISDFGRENICFYRVDTSVWETRENVLREALNPGYYVSSNQLAESRGYKNVSTGTDYSFPSLTAALEAGQREDLFIFITDLYENESENANILIDKFGELARKDDGKVFGCVAIRTPYAGEVRDIGAYSQSIEYGLDSDEIRPFYIVVRGYPEQVSDFCIRIEQRLNISSDDLASHIFYFPTYHGLDFQHFNTCEHYDRKVIWANKQMVKINDSVDMYVYEYRGKSDTLSEELLFSYLVPNEYREGFSSLAQQFDDLELVPTVEQQCYRLPIQLKDLQISYWSEKNTFENADNCSASFSVSRLSYDMDHGILYVGLQVRGFQSGIWRLQWRNVVANDSSFWWDEWGSHSGSRDFSKTERLGDYMGTIQKNAIQDDFCILNGCIYLSVKR